LILETQDQPGRPEAKSWLTFPKRSRKSPPPSAPGRRNCRTRPKQLLSEGKLKAAPAKFEALSGEKLSADEQALADGLKAQIHRSIGRTSKAPKDAATAVQKPPEPSDIECPG